MSFYIGFVTKNLVILAADRKFSYLGKLHSEAEKLKQINKNTWGVHIGAKFFGERWLWRFSHSTPKWLTNTYSGLKLISYSIQRSYVYHQKKMKKWNLKLEGFTNIAVAGFKKDKPFICAMDSKNKFRPVFCREGSIYSCVEENLIGIDEHIKKVTFALGLLQENSIDKQKDFIRFELQKIFMLLGTKYDHISREFDLVFITQDKSILETTEENRKIEVNCG